MEQWCGGRVMRPLTVAALVAVVMTACLMSAARAEEPRHQPIRLFGTVEFKAKIAALPNWTRVLKKMKNWQGYFRGDFPTDLPSRRAWLSLRREARDMDDVHQLRAVTAFFNRWPYRLDQTNYGRSDYWATPLEFMRHSGDCEDYAIAKFYALRDLGWSNDRLRIVVLKDNIRNITHAVVVAYSGDEAYVLDSLSNLVLSHSRYTHYLPQYSVNETYRWFHVRPVKRTPELRETNSTNQEGG